MLYFLFILKYDSILHILNYTFGANLRQIEEKLHKAVTNFVKCLLGCSVTLKIQDIHTISHKCSHNVVKYRRNLIFLKMQETS